MGHKINAVSTECGCLTGYGEAMVDIFYPVGVRFTCKNMQTITVLIVLAKKVSKTVFSSGNTVHWTQKSSLTLMNSSYSLSLKLVLFVNRQPTIDKKTMVQDAVRPAGAEQERSEVKVNVRLNDETRQLVVKRLG